MSEAVFDFKAIRAAMGKDIPLKHADAPQTGAPADQVKALADMLEKGNEVAWKEFTPVRDGHPALEAALEVLEGDKPYFVINSSCTCVYGCYPDDFCPHHGTRSALTGLKPNEEDELPF